MGNEHSLRAGALNHPLLRELNELSLRCCGISFLIVYPAGDHWGQAIPGKVDPPEFCSLIKISKQGGKQCRMSHVMMGMAASRGGITEHRCHAGSLILAHPLSNEKNATVALISSCLSSLGKQHASWDEARRVGKALGLNLRKLKKAHAALPAVDDNGQLAREFMKMAVDIIKEIQFKIYIETRLEEALSSRPGNRNLSQVLVDKLTTTSPDYAVKPQSISSSKIEKMVKITADLIGEHPGMPYNVEEVAASMRISPNHFSSEFHRCTGKRFSDFLTEQRIERSKTLLADITLNIEEVALEAGYTDSSYYARKFKQRTGKTPTQWRESMLPA
jgi:AraC-like DNA-binding protein